MFLFPRFLQAENVENPTIFHGDFNAITFSSEKEVLVVLCSKHTRMTFSSKNPKSLHQSITRQPPPKHRGDGSCTKHDSHANRRRYIRVQRLLTVSLPYFHYEIHKDHLYLSQVKGSHNQAIMHDKESFLLTAGIHFSRPDCPTDQWEMQHLSKSTHPDLSHLSGLSS